MKSSHLPNLLIKIDALRLRDGMTAEPLLHHAEKTGGRSSLFPDFLMNNTGKRKEHRVGALLPRQKLNLFTPPLMFGLFEQLFVLMLAHLLFAPFDNAPHSLTSLSGYIPVPDP